MTSLLSGAAQTTGNKRPPIFQTFGARPSGHNTVQYTESTRGRHNVEMGKSATRIKLGRLDASLKHKLLAPPIELDLTNHAKPSRFIAASGYCCGIDGIVARRSGESRPDEERPVLGSPIRVEPHHQLLARTTLRHGRPGASAARWLALCNTRPPLLRAPSSLTTRRLSVTSRRVVSVRPRWISSCGRTTPCCRRRHCCSLSPWLLELKTQMRRRTRQTARQLSRGRRAPRACRAPPTARLGKIAAAAHGTRRAWSITTSSSSP